MKRLAVCGWDAQSDALLRALTLRSDLRPVAIGDDRPASLVRARSATGLPCYQHVREMLRAVEYDAILIGDVGDREALLQIAAEHGAWILLRGDFVTAATLRAASAAVAAGAAGLNTVRPELNHAGVDLLTSLTGGEADWTPDLIQIELNEPASVDAVLNTATALVSRLQPEPASQVAVAALRAPTDDATSVNIQIRHAERALSIVTIEGHMDQRWRIAIQAPAGRAELTNRDGNSTLILEPMAGGAEQSELVDDNLLGLESGRLTDPASRRNDERFVPYEAALLTAIEGSMNTGFVAPVRDLGTRGNLRLLEGGDLTTSPRAGHLRIIG